MALISEENNFIFIHIFKTGGNSVRDVIQTEDCYEIHGVHADLHDTHKHLSTRNPDFYDSAFKFTVVRNPFDWMVSLFHYIGRAKSHKQHPQTQKGFAHFVHWYCYNPLVQQKTYGTNKDQQQSKFITNMHGEDDMDMIIKLEEIDERWEELCEKIGIDYTPLPKKNVSGKREKDYRGYYDSGLRITMEAAFKDDFEKFGYEY